jgi:hypothetical protein
MDYLTFTKLHQKHKIKRAGFKATLEWRGRDEDNAIVSFHINIGIHCFLHVNEYLQGSLFDFHYKNQLFTLILDYIEMRDCRVYKINFLID